MEGISYCPYRVNINGTWTNVQTTRFTPPETFSGTLQTTKITAPITFTGTPSDVALLAACVENSDESGPENSKSF
jgi:hypothetical protein